MNPFFKKIFLFFLLLFCLDTSAQDDIFTEKREKNNQPTFFIGSGLYTLNGDIKNENSGLLKGSSGVYAGIKFDVLKNIDLSFSLIKNSFSANNQVESFSSEINGVGLHLGYVPNWRLKFLKLQPIFSLGLEQYGVSTIISGESKDGSSMFAVASRLGIRMDFTDRLKFDITTSSGIAFGDIDMSSSEENDGFRSLNFTIHYDLFAGSGKKKDGFSNNNYYEDVDFEKLENEDEDSDLVLDIDDYCPGTPLGVKVDANGCPLDNDKDGIPNYLDKQKDTPLGSIVDENGVSLTADKYYGMYSDYEVASRKYANFYNELEIQREDYKTVDEYLIARANAFNKAYNESLRLNQTVETLVYKVKIGEFKEAIPPKIQNSLLSFNDLESFTMTSDVPNTKFFLEYIARPQTAEIFFEDVLMACVFYGMPILIENNKPRLLYHLKRRGYRGFSMNRPDKLKGALSKTELELGGIPNSSEDIKQAHASAIESYIEEYIGKNDDSYGNMYFQRTLEDWARFDISRRTSFDASISSGLAIMACRKHLYKPSSERTVKKLDFEFSRYKNEGYQSELIK